MKYLATVALCACTSTEPMAMQPPPAPTMIVQTRDVPGDPLQPLGLALGGTPSGIAHAQRESTDREIAFLARTLGGH